MDYNQLKFDIAQVIRTNGNEEITGEVLQYILLEMVSHLGLAYQFAGVATTETEPGEPDENKAWLIGAGTYRNFGDEFTVNDNELGVVMWNGVFTVKKITTGRAVVNELRIGSTNPVEGGVIAQQFAQLRAAGYLFAGLATLFMHVVTNFKVPVFLGSSFAFLGGYAAVKAAGVAMGYSERVSLNYACLGVACAGLVYFILALVCKAFGSKRVMRFFPPVVTGPIILSIGLILACRIGKAPVQIFRYRQRYEKGKG